MLFLWVLLTIHTVPSRAILAIFNVHARAGFGRSYLGNSRMCYNWTCINEKLNLTDELPPKDVYSATINSLFPSEWREVAESAVDSCYGNITKTYTNTCPGQALMHCVVDHLVKNCPANKSSKDDRCAPVSSLAPNNYMFSQSRYNNLESGITTERRPSYFLRNYFNMKCCDLPDILIENNLEECGFKKFMEYHLHDKQTDQQFQLTFPHKVQIPTTKKSMLEVDDSEEEWDPLECCDVNDFIKDSWRSECHLEMSWNETNRLGFIDISSHLPPTTTEKGELKRSDVKVVPLSCEKETCVFKKLNIILDSGEIDLLAFTKLLDSLTLNYPSWEKAKARVTTQCLTKIHRIYDAECQINELLSCVMDVLSENCPNVNKDHPCKDKDTIDKDVICQISSGKYSPKLRRQFCPIPNLVPNDVLSECGVTSLSTMQYVPHYERKMSRWESRYNCKELTPPTSCILKKMGVLNQYGFIDYFKMKNWLHKTSSSPFYEVFFSTFLVTPMYQEYCSSPKKLLNILDIMVTTCPESKRTQNTKCKKIFNEIKNTPNVSQEKLDQLFKVLYNTTEELKELKPSQLNSETHSNKMFDFGILGSDAPPVKIIDVKRKPKTLVVLPVYQRMNASHS
ncbi:uncharacterized protein LOC123720869 isoform X1 [Pieris brassicae]|uniref:uncharacterized protein LOC123720869 isoform X1 n=1 Tax=Pieris brassicae TaxID=7116 RepID=UPI001E65F444|nr:uncharacterized protein LOC123720869 isoform X1 [Pieris brassicae]